MTTPQTRTDSGDGHNTTPKEPSDRRKIALQLLAIAVLMLVGMTAYETLKQIIAPDIAIWESHFTTIVFSTLCATVISYFVLRRHIALNRALHEKNCESERLRRELENTVQQLTEAMSKIKTLTGLLPICASCKKIRDDQGYWNQLESYIAKYSDADFSHTICPECARKLYPEFLEDDEEQ